MGCIGRLPESIRKYLNVGPDISCSLFSFSLDLRPFSIVMGQLTQRDLDVLDEAQLAKDNASLLDTDCEDVNDDIPAANCHMINRQSLKTRLLGVHAKYPINIAGTMYHFEDLE